jgi:hypothetical protein
MNQSVFFSRTDNKVREPEPVPLARKGTVLQEKKHTGMNHAVKKDYIITRRTLW